MKIRSNGLEKMRTISGLSFSEALIFWGLTVIGSGEEPWGRVAMTNWAVPIIVDKTRTGTPIQMEIYNRIINSGHRDKTFNRRVKPFLESFTEVQEDIPKSLVPILNEKFKVIMF
jgi:hypothetical protein